MRSPAHHNTEDDTSSLKSFFGGNMTSTEKIKEIEKTLNETTDHMIRGFNKIQRLVESLKEKK